MTEDAEYELHERWHIETAEYSSRLLGAAQACQRYAGAELRFESRELIIFAAGGPNEATAALVREAPSSIRVTWQEAPYTFAELTAEAEGVKPVETRSR